MVGNASYHRSRDHADLPSFDAFFALSVELEPLTQSLALLLVETQPSNNAQKD